MTASRLLPPLLLLGTLAGCQSFGYDGFSGAGMRNSTWRCSDNVTLTLQGGGSMLKASDSRGFNADLPASPPGQSTRYSEGIYALILEGRNATWFVSGQKPVECRR